MQQNQQQQRNLDDKTLGWFIFYLHLSHPLVDFRSIDNLCAYIISWQINFES
jgi:hypothetical protein